MSSFTMFQVEGRSVGTRGWAEMTGMVFCNRADAEDRRDSLTEDHKGFKFRVTEVGVDE